MVTASFPSITGATYTWADYMIPVCIIATAIFLTWHINKERVNPTIAPSDVETDKAALRLAYMGILIGFMIAYRKIHMGGIT